MSQIPQREMMMDVEEPTFIAIAQKSGSKYPPLLIR
jgi:hypothetical protein